MKLALDCQVSFNCAKALILAGHTVVYHARQEHDQLWTRRALDKGADCFVSPDWDIDILCNQWNLRCIRLKQRMSSEETLVLILKTIGFV